MRTFATAALLYLPFVLSIGAQTQSFWTTSAVPANPTGNDETSVELGLIFSPNVGGNVTGTRVYCATNSSGVHSVHLWDSNGNQLASATLPACVGWTAVNFATPVPVSAGSTYTISYHTTEYPWDAGFFSSPITSGNLSAPANAGVYAYGDSPTYPTESWDASNYWVDVLFIPSGSTQAVSIWSDFALPGNPSEPDPSSVELGLLFQSDVAGLVTGVRFYKGLGNTGTHIGNLWTTSGINLASVMFENETTLGWQQASFSSPVAISANTPYIISYYAPNGGYAADLNFFAAAGVNSPPLHALANSAASPNGVYLYATGGGFPTNTYMSTNYWVDVVFEPAGPTTTYSISGTITGGSGATVTLSGASSATTTAGSSGNYTFSGLVNGNYTITPSETGLSFNPASTSVTVSGANLSGINFSATAQQPQTFTISGTISPSAGGGSATVILGGAASATTNASASGTYSFSGLANGSYTVTPTNPGYTFSPPTQSVVISGASATGVNFSASGGFMISGTLSPAKYAVGATVALTGPVNATATITGSSAFAFTGLPPGSYTVAASSPSATFTPSSQSVSINNQNVSSIAFAAASTQNVIFFDNFLQPTLSSAWTAISRHGEYAQGETECNIPQQVTTGSGLTITTAAQNWTCGDFNIDGTTRHAPTTWPYITGDVQWTNQNFTYGTVEVRAKFPSSATNLWPAIWMLGSNCQLTNIYTADTGYASCAALGSAGYIETDMVECYNSGGWCQFHVANPSFGIGNGCDASYPVDTNWHTYDTVWTAAGIQQYMDGALITTCNQSISNPMFLIIQTQTGGVGGTPNNANLPAQLMVDYVKVAQP